MNYKIIVEEKFKNQKTQYKNETKEKNKCLVVRGFEERLTDERIDSPTISRQVLCPAIVTASIKHWDLYSVNIPSAFLQGNEIKRTVHVKPPLELHQEGKLCY